MSRSELEPTSSPANVNSALLDLIEEHGRARVSDLADQFGVSAVTIRKDLLSLESRGRITRAHGGAIAAGTFTTRERVRGPRTAPT